MMEPSVFESLYVPKKSISDVRLAIELRNSKMQTTISTAVYNMLVRYYRRNELLSLIGKFEEKASSGRFAT